MNISRTLNIESSEKVSFGFLIIQSVFFGFYFGTMDIVSHTLFLEEFTQEDLSKAYVVSGVIGIILTALYSSVQGKIKFSRFAILNLLIIVLFIALLRFAFEILPQKEISFILFVIFFPLFILSMLGFWGSVTRIYNLRQGKRLFGIIDSGLIIGIILSSFSIPFILASGFSVVNLLFISFAGTLCALIIQFFISNKYLTKNENNEDEIKTTEKINFVKQLSKDKYIRIMSVFVVLSVITGFFIQYLFLGVTKQKYPEEINFAQFFGAFMGLIMTVTLIVKTTVYSKLLKNYGLKVSLIISPVILLFFSLLAAITGSFFGFSVASGGGILFFLAIALSKLLGKTLKDSIEIPAFKLLYQSLSAKIRFNIQSKIDGTVNEISALISGLSLTLFGLISFFKLIHYTYVLIFVVAIWTYIAQLLYKSYKYSLNRSLELASNVVSVKNNDNDIISWFKEHFLLLNNFQKLFGLRIINQFLPFSEPDLQNIIISQNNYSHLIPEINDFMPGFGNQNVKKHSNILSDELGPENILKLVRSKNVEHRKLAAEYLIENKSDNEEALLILLKDFHYEVHYNALKSSIRFNNPAITQLLVDDLFSKEYVIVAFHCLKIIGKDILNQLRLAFYKTDIDVQEQLRIVRLYREIKCDETTKELEKLLFNHNRLIVTMSLKALSERNYKVPESLRYQHFQQIIRFVETIAWNTNVLSVLRGKNDEDYNELLQSINKEQTENFNTLFNYLSIIYDSKSINHVKDNLEKGGSESSSFAIELLDLFIDEELKATVLPILEDIPDHEKVKLLQDEFPLKKYTEEEVILKIINRDYQEISIWTKACAINTIKKIKNDGVKKVLISNIFNPNILLAQMSYIKLREFIDQNELDSIMKRNKILKNQFDFNLKINQFSLVLFLKKIEYFKNISDHSLTRFVNEFKPFIIDNNNLEKIITNNDHNYFIIETGGITIRKNKDVITFNMGDIFDKCLIRNDNYTIEIKGELKLYKVPDSVINELALEDIKLAESIINYITAN